MVLLRTLYAALVNLAQTLLDLHLIARCVRGGRATPGSSRQLSHVLVLINLAPNSGLPDLIAPGLCRRRSLRSLVLWRVACMHWLAMRSRCISLCRPQNDTNINLRI
jgi:hypothetical protein